MLFKLAEKYAKYPVDRWRNLFANVSSQLDEIEVTARDVLPLMNKMVDKLESFVALDVPFLIEERTRTFLSGFLASFASWVVANAKS